MPVTRRHARLHGAPILLLTLLVFSAAWSPAISPAHADTLASAQAQSIIAKVPTPYGIGGGLAVIRDGDRPARGTGDTRRQYDSWDGNNPATEDWVGYTFASAQTFTRVVFQEGVHFWDGGWFLSLTVQVRQSGQWVAVRNLVTTPAYAGNNGMSFDTYTLGFDPIQGDGIRIYGAPGGAAAFISVGELDVYVADAGSAPAPPPTGGTEAAVSAQAQSIIAKVPTPYGIGGGLAVIRDGDRPARGTGDTRRQYDSWDGNNPATEDWVGYTFASAQTFTRVVFQEGVHFWDGGWFLSLTVQVRQSGQWVAVRNLVTTPAYAGNNGMSFDTYTLGFDPIQGDGIRIYGAPGGAAAFISVGELDVYASTGGGGGGTATPDLTVASLGVSPGSVSPAGTLNVSFTARNAGTAAAGASSAGLYLATSATATPGASTSLKTVAVPSLSAGASAVVATTVTLPSTGAGAYFILAAADPGAAIAESSETNNTTTTGFNVVTSTGGITIWVTDTLARVQPTDAPGTARSAAIKAARNEYEAFQLIVRAPSGQGLTGVNATVSDLVGPGTIPRANVTLYRAHYVTVTQSSPASPYPPGRYADALIPFTHPETGQALGGRFPAAPFPVSAGQNQPIWVEVYVPTTASPGTYTGTVTVTASGVSATVVPITLTVWNFTLPKISSYRSVFGELWDAWAPFGLSPTSTAGVELDWRFAKAALAHRVTASRPMKTLGWYASDGAALPADDRLREWLDTMGATSWKIPEFFGDPLGADRPRMIRYLRTLYDYLAARGWADRAFIYPPRNDEPNSSQDYQGIRDYAAMVHEANPNLKVLVTEQPTPEDSAWGSLTGSVDIWVPVVHNYTAAAAQARQAAGDEVFVYTTGAYGTGKPTFLIDYPLLDYRVHPWIGWVNRVNGLLYWQMTHWTEVADVWTDVRTLRWGGHAFNGDGSLFYPGNAVGYEGPIVSARLKALRDGMEDYEYLKLLSGILGVSTADTLARTVGTTYSSWNTSPLNLQTTRETLGRRIELRQ